MPKLKPGTKTAYKLKHLPKLVDDCLQVIGEQLHLIKATPACSRTPTELLFVLKASNALQNFSKEHREDQRDFTVKLINESTDVLKDKLNAAKPAKDKDKDDDADSD
jgi:hypothetical protein